MICNLEFLFSNTQTKCKGKKFTISSRFEINRINEEQVYQKQILEMYFLGINNQINETAIKIKLYVLYTKKLEEQGIRKSMVCPSIYFLYINQQFDGLQILRFQSALSLIVYNYFNMKNIILVLALAYLTTSVIVVRSQVGDTIVYPGSPHPAALNNYPYNVDLSGSGAVWIWDTNWNNPLTPSPIVVTDDFYASCTSEMILNATADNNFTATLNTNDILSGDDWRKVYSVKFKPKCGRNNFSVTAHNWGVGSQGNPAGVVYWISQDTSSCYFCKPGQVWNPATCSCQCAADPCPCRKNQIWSGLPDCQCICAKVSKCNQNQYWDQNSCSCRCLPKVCRQNYSQNPNTCQCQCNSQNCPRNFYWSYTTCRCERGGIIIFDAILN